MVSTGGGGGPAAPSGSAPSDFGLEVPADPLTAAELHEDPMAELQELEEADAAAAAADRTQTDDCAFGHEWEDFGTSSARSTSETSRARDGSAADRREMHSPQPARIPVVSLFNGPFLRTQPPSLSQEAGPPKRRRVIGKQPDSVPSRLSSGARDEGAHVPGAVRSCPGTLRAPSGPAAASSTCGPVQAPCTGFCG